MRTMCLLLVMVAVAAGQGTKADYERAAGLGAAWRGKLREFKPALRWLPEEKGVAWKDPAGDGWIVVEVGGDGPRAVPDLKAFGLDDKPLLLEPRDKWGRSPQGGSATSITFENRLDRKVRLFWVDGGGRTKAYGEIEPGKSQTLSTYVGHVWLGDFAANDLTGVFVAVDSAGIARFDEESRRLAKGEPEKPRRFRMKIVDHDVVGIDARGREFEMTADGTEERRYGRAQAWSPDGKKAIVLRTRPGEGRRIPLVESTPRDQLQPKLHWQNYVKPGDRIDEHAPVILDFARKKVVEVAAEPFDAAWRIGDFRWSKDGKEVFCLYNRRGHQVLAVLAIDARTGKVRDLVRETSATFIDYSQKTLLRWLDDGDRFLWMSERDGNNHLYLHDAKKGALIRQLSSGDWRVRRIEHIDEEKGQIWFTALGIRPEQDPYHEHLVRVGLDGEGLTVLTAGDGTHAWEFSPGRELIIDRWSRVDQPEVTELRRARDGSLVAELGRDDAGALEAAGFAAPERFTAKGRDGQTDIHGIIIRPSNFEASRRYPVIEAIYAGPHGFHVPKRFGLGIRQRMLAELGFIVVQIDGMGTNWRSKAFHDVCWRNLKDAGFPDRIAWMKAAAARHPEMDLERVGIFGGSAGGQNTVAALLHHGDFYDVGVADCGCHDNRMDKIWWNEAWMGEMGPHYADSSNVTHAAKLGGKLMLTVGELDRNVDPASTMQLVDALIRAEKDFDLVVVPGGGHGVGEMPYLVRRRQDFFVRALLGLEPRR